MNVPIPLPVLAVAVAGALLAACGTRSELTADFVGGGVTTSSSTSTTSSTGGGAATDCVALTVTAPADIDTGGGTSARPALVFGTNNGRVVSVFHAWSDGQSLASELRVATVEPWESWPPVAGDRFAVDPQGGSSFAVGDLLLGNVALLLMGDHGLNFANAVSATSPQTLELLSLTADSEDPGDPAAVTMVRGYDAPPVAPNIGYFAMLLAWDRIDPTSGAHALKLGIGDGSWVLFGTAQHLEDPDLACASARIAAAAVRARSSWLVLTATGGDLLRCSDVASPSPPASLAVDLVAWGPPDSVDWTLQRVDYLTGTDPIKRVRMIPSGDGGLALVQRTERVDLVRLDAQGQMSMAGTVAPVAGDGAIVFSEIAPLSNATLVAHVDGAAPGRVHLELRDPAASVVVGSLVDASGPISSLSVLTDKAGNAAVLGWATSDGQVQVARVACAEGT